MLSLVFMNRTNRANRIRARVSFLDTITVQGIAQAVLAREAGVSVQTIARIIRPDVYNLTGQVREANAWRIARAFARLTSMEPERAFVQLFETEGV